MIYIRINVTLNQSEIGSGIVLIRLSEISQEKYRLDEKTKYHSLLGRQIPKDYFFVMSFKSYNLLILMNPNFLHC